MREKVLMLLACLWLGIGLTMEQVPFPLRHSRTIQLMNLFMW